MVDIMKFSFMHVQKSGDTLYASGCFIFNKKSASDIAAFEEIKQKIKEVNDGCLKSDQIIEKKGTIYFLKINLKALCQTLEYWRDCFSINLVYSAHKRIIFSGGATMEEFEKVLENNKIHLKR